MALRDDLAEQTQFAEEFRAEVKRLRAALEALRAAVHEHRLLDVRKRFSLCAADAQAVAALAATKGTGTVNDEGEKE